MKQHLPDHINLFEAKTHFSNLIRRVQDGKQIIIYKHNVPVAKIIPITQKPQIEDIAEKFAEFSKDKTLAPYTIKELINEGRKW